MDDDLLNMKKYPKTMYMDMYGNGHNSFDQIEHKNIHDVIFRVKYIRADLVAKQSIQPTPPKENE